MKGKSDGSKLGHSHTQFNYKRAMSLQIIYIELFLAKEKNKEKTEEIIFYLYMTSRIVLLDISFPFTLSLYLKTKRADVTSKTEQHYEFINYRIARLNNNL